MVKVAINGLSRIGRIVLRIAAENPQLEVLAVNETTDDEHLVYRLKNDALYGSEGGDIRVDGDYLYFGDQRIRRLGEAETGDLPWNRLDIDIVFECNGQSHHRDEMAGHIEAGARCVIACSPESESEVIYRLGSSGIDGDNRLPHLTERCSTQCIAPVAEVLGRRIGVSKAVTTTIQSYISTRGMVDIGDAPFDNEQNGVLDLFAGGSPTSAAIARILPYYVGHIDGMDIRVPMVSGAISDMTFVTERPTTVREVNDILREEAQTSRYAGILSVSEHPVVSADVIKDPHASLVDLSRTRVVDSDLVKVLSWVDNEWGYASQMVKQATRLLQ